MRIKLYQLLLLLLGLIILLICGCSRMQTPDFQHLSLPSSPNVYLACPQKFCNVTPNIFTPIYAVSANDLYALFTQVMANQTNVNFVYQIPEQGQFGLTAYSTVFRFPEDVSVQFIALSDNTSTIAILSKSRYGYYDFGVNQEHVNKWLSALQQQVNKFVQK